ncbi:efflux RND transporter periplasmic adaptor subunit [Spirosoma sp. BT702]|uniref:Efflux RND transporter periplasmic adaptor subunit n=1 Tax=Spirosoma profusum TaxID=2771354 RepID=A0A927ASG8_9BACT|nr:efflux RND transporter periplasmic adaptor subunit [Spirosoma profusum]MBD2701250.1 efflux RND transporter periplasmic adaptor subunit [Spirosoma profusum]
MKSIIFLVSLLWLTTACNPSTENEGTEKGHTAHEHEEGPSDVVELTDDQIRIGGVELGKVENRSVGQQLAVHGRLAVPAQSQIAITALQGGFVRKVPLLPGQPVRKGQVLATIENPELVQWQQDFAENHSRLTYLDAEYTRQKELSEQNVSALKVFQQTTAERNATRARLGGLTQRLKLVGLSPQSALNGTFSSSYVIMAPASGVVTNVAVNAGQYVQPSDVIAHLTSNQGLYAELTVFEKDLPLIREGQRVGIRLSNEGGKERSGRIAFINRAIDNDRSVRVVAKLDQVDARLTSNTFLDAHLDVGATRVTALPEAAIVSAEGKEYIFIKTDEVPEHQEHEHEADEKHDHKEEKEAEHGTAFKQIPVRRGVTEDGYSQVTLPGRIDWSKAQVVVKGAYDVLSQLKAAGGEEEGHSH